MRKDRAFPHSFDYSEKRAGTFNEFIAWHKRGTPAYLIRYEKGLCHEFIKQAQAMLAKGFDVDASYLKEFLTADSAGNRIGDDDNLFSYLKLAFLYGEPEALFDLAYFFWTGRGLKRNLKVAIDLFRQSGMLGFAPAWFELGLINFYGIGTKRDFARSRDCFSRAMEISDVDCIAYRHFIDAVSGVTKPQDLLNLSSLAFMGSKFASYVILKGHSLGLAFSDSIVADPMVEKRSRQFSSLSSNCVDVIDKDLAKISHRLKGLSHLKEKGAEEENAVVNDDGEEALD